MAKLGPRRTCCIRVTDCQKFGIRTEGTAQLVKDRSVILVESGGPSHKSLRLFAAPLVIAQAMIFLQTEHFDYDLIYRELARRLTVE